MIRFILVSGALNAFLAVACGAFAAHVLKQRLDEYYLAIFDTGAEYQMYHALALVLTGILYGLQPQAMLSAAAWCFFAGIILFSGSLYTLALTGIKWLGMITPIGGLCLLAGWVLLAISQAGTKS